MDHGRRVGRKDTSLTLKRPCNPSVVTVTDPPCTKDKPIVEDRRLKNWKTWLRRHRIQCEALRGRVSNPKADMVMNSCEKVRAKIEMRNLMEYAAAPVTPVPGKSTGSPGFWKVPPILSNHGNPCLPDVGPVLTKKELNSFPTLEHIEVPKCIREEKNLSNLEESVPGWKRSSYLSKRREELAGNIAILKPSRPETETDLVVRGRRFGCSEEEQEVPRLPVISVTDASIESEESEVKIMAEEAVVVTLEINGVRVTRDEETIHQRSEDLVWPLTFLSAVNQRSKKCLRLENKGTMVIAYEWRDAAWVSKILPSGSRSGASFFFNKNKALILPGQKTEIPVWFQKRRAGIFSESWRLDTEPKLHGANLIVRMWGCASSEDSGSGRSIDAYLDRCIRDTSVRETLDFVISNVSPSRPQEPAYQNCYLEAELFRAKNPSYFYHSSAITDLYKLWDTCLASNVATTWNLSLVELRSLLLRIDDPELRNERLKLFSDLCKECLKPDGFSTDKSVKYGVVYNVLCAFANRMEEESAIVKQSCILRQPDDLASINSTVEISPESSSSGMMGINGWRGSLKSTEIFLYGQVFYTRIYELLVESMEQICAAIDSVNNLNELEQ
ncbi:MYCBP-associated protein-like [Neodiprion lecontei]|uniref:MYCBP-associated protein-like n=1 Tax=Neodiprion lecontei TaxID=441921 RepID=A0ABM3G0Y3_NEOLC|nr:MYCBP-associated protein-like [Neodiprion lecontei]